MANSHQTSQPQTTVFFDYSLYPSGNMNYQQSSSTRQFESNTNNHGRLPLSIASETLLSMSMGFADNGQSPGPDLENLLGGSNEIDVSLNYNWNELITNYDETSLETIPADFCSPSQLQWPQGPMHSDDMFNDKPFQAMVPERYNDDTTLSSSSTFLSAGPITPSASSGRYTDPYESEEMVNMLDNRDQRPQDAVYVCGVCSKGYPKRYLLNSHKEIHEKRHICPICLKCMAKSRDMKRHFEVHQRRYAKAHALPPLSGPRCPVAGCKGAKSGFARRDHLRRHLRKAHPGQLT